MCFFIPGLRKHPSVIWQEEARARSLRGHNLPVPLLLWGAVKTWGSQVGRGELRVPCDCTGVAEPSTVTQESCL